MLKYVIITFTSYFCHLSILKTARRKQVKQFMFSVIKGDLKNTFFILCLHKDKILKEHISAKTQ